MVAMRSRGRGVSLEVALEIKKQAAEAVGGSSAADVEPALEISDYDLTIDFSNEYVFREGDYDVLNSLGGARSRAPKFEDLADEYRTLWSEMAVRRDHIGSVEKIVSQIQANKPRYLAVENTTGVPWYMISLLHAMEAGLRFNGHLHNGDPLTRRTVHVPVGRPKDGQPPFDWETSAIDALNYDGLTKNNDWSLEKIAFLLESFNGWGYRLHHPDVKSPYLWSFSNQYSQGKYVADGKWSPTAVSKQCGALVILWMLDSKGLVRVQFRSQFESASAAGGAGAGVSQDSSRDRQQDSGFEGDDTGYDVESTLGCEEDIDDLGGSAGNFAATAFEVPAAVPAGNPVPFAHSGISPDRRFWPVKSQHPARFSISYQSISGRIIGNNSRKFLGNRNGGARFHVAIDLYAYENDVVVACEDGKIVNFYGFYPSSKGEMTYALLVEHGNFVVNYGEVKSSAPSMYNWRVGDSIVAGQPIARVSSTSMLHFETYQIGTRRNSRWLPGGLRPRSLLNPTAYLIEIAQKSNFSGS